MQSHIKMDIALSALLSLSACGSVLPDAGMTADRGVNEAAGTPADRFPETLRASAQGLVQTYVQAVVDGDGAKLLEIASPELRQRIQTRGPVGNLDQRLAAFLYQQRRQLQRELIDPKAQLETMPSAILVASAEPTAGTALALTLSLGGRTVPKPFFLVRSGDSFKVNVVAPAGIEKTTHSRYRVQNDDYVEREYYCSDYGPYTIAPYPAQRLEFCTDSCHGGLFGWFDGTTFTTILGGVEQSADCDYNTWGVDMYIKSGLPVCADPC